MDRMGIQVVDDAREKLEAELQTATDLNDIERTEEAQEKLDQFDKFLRENRMPDGSARKMTTGDPSINATRTMRQRKRTLLKNLRSEGLGEMADHIEDCYKIRTYSFSYSGSNLKIA